MQVGGVLGCWQSCGKTCFEGNLSWRRVSGRYVDTRALDPAVSRRGVSPYLQVCVWRERCTRAVTAALSQQRKVWSQSIACGSEAGSGSGGPSSSSGLDVGKEKGFLCVWQRQVSTHRERKAKCRLVSAACHLLREQCARGDGRKDLYLSRLCDPRNPRPRLPVCCGETRWREDGTGPTGDSGLRVLGYRSTVESS